ncbi:lipocalin family protein [Marinobacter sp. 1Y8]
MNPVKRLWLVCVVGASVWLTACTGLPENVTPVNNFDAERYLGTWYEVARLPHSFEEGLSQVKAEYTLKDDGNIRVVNTGYSAESGEWERAEGVAKFVESPDVGHLKVSFWGPFYASYVVVLLDHDNYQYSLVTGPDKDYLWLLSREKQLPDEVKDEMLKVAGEAGYPLDELIWVDQSDSTSP